MDIDVSIVIGVSFISLASLEYEDLEERLETTVSETDLNYDFKMSGIDEIHDVFVGVKFREERPTDAQVAEATKLVQEKLPEIEKHMKEKADSDVGTWFAVSCS